MRCENGDRSDFHALNSLTKKAREDFQALQMTNEYEHLEKISDKVQAWCTDCEQALQQLGKLPADTGANLQEQTQLVAELDALAVDTLPVPAELLARASKVHKLRRWKLKY